VRHALGSANGETGMSTTADEPSVRSGYEPQADPPASLPGGVNVAKPAPSPITISNRELHEIAVHRLERIKSRLRADPERGGASGSRRSNDARVGIWQEIAAFEEIVARIYGPRTLPV
jgi:hypothetical protein